MHRSRLPLTTWFWAAHLMTTHSNGMSALQLHETLLGLAADKEPAPHDMSLSTEGIGLGSLDRMALEFLSA